MKNRPRIRPQVEVMEGRLLLNAGDLDLTFGGTGMVSTQLSTYSNPASFSYSSLVQPTDGKVVTAGEVAAPIYTTDGKYWSLGDHVGVARYNVDGSLDTTFGTGGKVVLPSGNNTEVILASALQSDGKIVLAGFSATLNSTKGKLYGTWGAESVEVLRLNTNGTLDTTFGVGGRAAPSTALSPLCRSIAVQSDGKIVLGAMLNANTTAQQFVVARLNSNGTLDPSFGTGGQTVTPLTAGDSSECLYNMAIDPAGRIVAEGRAILTNGNSRMEVVRYTTAGAFDATFGTGGKVLLSPGSGTGLTSAQGIGFQSTGKIVISGQAVDPATTAREQVFLRLNTSGTLDTSFGTAGVDFEPRMLNGSFSLPHSIAIDPTDDKIIAAGNGWVNGQYVNDIFVTRVLADGSSSDPTFGQGGIARAGFSPLMFTPSSVDLTPDGKVVVSAMDASGLPIQHQFRTFRFLGDPPPPAPQVALADSRPVAAATATNSTRVPLVVVDGSFQDSLSSHKQMQFEPLERREVLSAPAGSPVAIQSAPACNVHCHEINAGGEGQITSFSPTGQVTTSGTIDNGLLRGTTQFSAQIIDAQGDYRGTTTIVTKQGMVSLTDIGKLNAGGTFTDYATITGGTGRFTGATGSLVFQGHELADGVHFLDDSITGEICYDQ